MRAVFSLWTPLLRRDGHMRMRHARAAHIT